MMHYHPIRRLSSTVLQILFFFSVLFPGTTGSAQEKKALALTDMMKFRQIKSPLISEDGQWVVHTARPDRGDPEVIVYATDGKQQFTIPRGEKPVLSRNGEWVAAIQAVPAEDKIKDSEKRNGTEQGLVLLNTSTGDQQVIEKVKSFSITNDNRWLAVRHFREDNNGIENYNKNQRPSPEETGTLLELYSLGSDKKLEYPFVKQYSIDSTSSYLAYVIADTTGQGNGVYVVNLRDAGQAPLSVFKGIHAWGRNLSWTRRTHHLAFLGGILNHKHEPDEAALCIWSPGMDAADSVLVDGQLREGWKIYHKNRLSWTKDGNRLFLGTKPVSEIMAEEEVEEDTLVDLFDMEQILAGRELDVWHWNDPLIIPNQKMLWKNEKDRTYLGVYHLDSQEFVQLADTMMPGIRIPENPDWCLGYSSLPHLKRITWDTRYYDYYLVNLQTGKRKMILETSRWHPRLSPDGHRIVYYRKGEWFMMDTERIESRNLTENLGIPFTNEDHDYPYPAPGYGVAGWVGGSEAALIYDKYDIWQFPSDGSPPSCLTEGRGRKGKYIFRIRNLDPERLSYKAGEQVFLEAYHDLQKFTAIYEMDIGKPGIHRLAEEPAKYRLLSRAKEEDRILYTRESYSEFPNLRISDPRFKKPRKITDLNPQISEFAWGKAELVEWSSMDGRPLQGVLIRPGNYRPGKKYPVLVYFYRFMSDRLHEFSPVVINHRPCFPYYAGNGYAVFLPDIRFDIGYPGFSATKCLVPGVQKLIDMGIADPRGIALHGHSWSGYQTAFVITQTDLFACAVAGAPVSNMTSAYSGIRLESGLARQMQYEKSQSRIGGSLWEYPERYIENSPVFYADRIHTPLLIQFGDEDGAVPWQQGIELYLAMRRLGKDCVFLQYRGEPHHLQEYPNRLDYTIKFKEYLDHYCKGAPAPAWLSEGVPYKRK